MNATVSPKKMRRSTVDICQRAIQKSSESQVLTARDTLTTLSQRYLAKKSKVFLSNSQQTYLLLILHHFQFATVPMELLILTVSLHLYSNILHKKMTKKTNLLSIQNLMVSIYQNFPNALEWMDPMPEEEKSNADKLEDLQPLVIGLHRSLEIKRRQKDQIITNWHLEHLNFLNALVWMGIEKVLLIVGKSVDIMDLGP